jgi:enoyl-CoA hydratase
MGITVEIAGKIATVSLDFPPVNALTTEAYDQLGNVFAGFAQQPDINCAILKSSSDRAFCAGKDLKEFLATRVEDDPSVAAVVFRAFERIRHCAVPVIAAVNGAALGAGCVIASLCDIIVASPRARFGLTEVNVGRCGGASHLGLHLPRSTLRRMYFTAEPLSAGEAYRVGLVSDLVPADELYTRVAQIAATIAKKSPIGLRTAKRSLDEIEQLQVEDGYAREQRYSTQLMATEDAREASRAAVEKRQPVFVGR